MQKCQIRCSASGDSMQVAKSSFQTASAIRFISYHLGCTETPHTSPKARLSKESLPHPVSQDPLLSLPYGTAHSSRSKDPIPTCY